MRDKAVGCSADAFAFTDGVAISVPRDNAFLLHVAKDFTDYLFVSQNVRACATTDDAAPALVVSLDPGPGGYYLSKAVACGELGLKHYTMANTAGLTWDLGTVPYLPCPYQWKKRWDKLEVSHREHGLSGLMESHHYGW